MGARSLLPDDIERYVGETIAKETPVQKRLRAETAKLPMAGMQIGPDQGALLALLVRLIGAKRTIEVGTFTGYSALSVAQALPEGGKVVACDINEEWTSIGRRYWKEAGLADRIDLRLGPAAATLKVLLEADGYNPQAATATPPSPPSPFTVSLLDNVQRLKLDVQRVVPVHYPADNRVVTMAEITKWVGRTGSAN